MRKMTLTYAPELRELYDTNGIPLPDVKKAGGAAVALMSQPDMRGGNGWVNRESAKNFFDKQGISSADPIQPFNKPGGSHLLARINVKGQYSLKFPFEFVNLHKRQDVKINVLKNGTKEEQVRSVKTFQFETAKRHMKDAEMFLRLYELERNSDVYDRLMEECHIITEICDTILCLPTEKWQIGHLIANPPKEANDPDNLYYQPEIQSKYRDNYIFNHMFQKIKVKD